MIRVVLDANILAPGFISTSSGAVELIRLWRDHQRYELVVSEHILQELARSYGDPYFRARVSDHEVDRIVSILRQRAVFTEITAQVVGVATQPKDDLILATALSAGARYIATRDRQLLKLGAIEDVEIVVPGRLLAVLRGDA